MRKAKEYLIGCEHDGSYIPVNEVLRIIKSAQIDAIEAACKRCAEEAEADFEPLGWLAEQHMSSPFMEGEDYEVPVIRTTILEVADKMKEEINEPIV